MFTLASKRLFKCGKVPGFFLEIEYSQLLKCHGKCQSWEISSNTALLEFDLGKSDL